MIFESYHRLLNLIDFYFPFTSKNKSIFNRHITLQRQTIKIQLQKAFQQFRGLYPSIHFEIYFEVWQDMMKIIMDSREVANEMELWAKRNGF
jgi:hypothetical protein